MSPVLSCEIGYSREVKCPNRTEGGRQHRTDRIGKVPAGARAVRDPVRVRKPQDRNREPPCTPVKQADHPRPQAERVVRTARGVGQV